MLIEEIFSVLGQGNTIQEMHLLPNYRQWTLAYWEIFVQQHFPRRVFAFNYKEDKIRNNLPEKAFSKLLLLLISLKYFYKQAIRCITIPERIDGETNTPSPLLDLLTLSIRDRSFFMAGGGWGWRICFPGGGGMALSHRQQSTKGTMENWLLMKGGRGS